jgi:hypothetical protein
VAANLVFSADTPNLAGTYNAIVAKERAEDGERINAYVDLTGLFGPSFVRN